jgi:hypothetical protein
LELNIFICWITRKAKRRLSVIFNKFQFFIQISTTKFSYAVYGDLGNENARSLGKIQKLAQDGDFDMVLHVGDFAYNMNSVSNPKSIHKRFSGGMDHEIIRVPCWIFSAFLKSAKTYERGSMIFHIGEGG